MLSFPTNIIETGSWKEKYFNFIDKLKYPLHINCFKKLNEKYKNADNNSRIDFYLKYAYEITDKELPILDSRNLPEVLVKKTENKSSWDTDEVYIIIDDVEYTLRDTRNRYTGFLVICYDKNSSPDCVRYMTWNEKTGWFFVDEFNDNKHVYWGNRHCVKRTSSCWDNLKLRFKQKSLAVTTTFIHSLYRILHTIDSCYLCMKFPFLYTRNRFTDRHFTNWTILNYVRKVYKKNSFNADVYFNKKDEYVTFPYGSVSPVIHKRLVQNPENPDKENIKDTEYYISVDNKEYVILYKTYSNHYRYYPVKVCDEYVVYNLDKEEWISLKNQEYVEYSYQNKDDSDYTVKSYHVIVDKMMYKFGQCLEWFHNNILGVLFFLPTRSELDGMDEGWRRAFGLDMMKEMKVQLNKDKMLYKHRIMDIKEKFGTLRYYCNYASSEVYDIISKYENISYKTCINCGKPARYITSGWICPYCEDCINPDSLDSATDLLKPDEDEHEEYITVHI